MHKSYSHEQLDHFCIFEFIDCERDYSCNYCNLASSRSGILRLSNKLCEVIKIRGVEDALKYYEKLRYIFGIVMVNALKKKLGDKEISPDYLKNVLSGYYSSFGMEYKIISGNDSVTVSIYNCPFYAELSRAGLDNSLIKAFCEHGSKGEHVAFTKAFPTLEPVFAHRTNINDTCREGYRINGRYLG